MLRLDYILCGLTISSTLLVGRKRREGWIVAGLNSVFICFIGWNTAELGFIPANIFCLALYAYNLREWSRIPTPEVSEAVHFNSDGDAVAGNAPIKA